MRTVMSEATEELERRAIELYTDLNEVVKATPEGSDKEFLGKALAHLSTGALLLKATTDVFKAQHDTLNQMKGNTQCGAPPRTRAGPYWPWRPPPSSPRWAWATARRMLRRAVRPPGYRLPWARSPAPPGPG